MPIDTHLDATPADITASAVDVGKVKTAVDEAEIDVSRANRTMQSGELQGETAEQVKAAVGLKERQCQTLSSSLGSYKTALENFASGLTTIKSDLAGVREKATAGGLTVEGEKVMEPQAPPPLPKNNPSSGTRTGGPIRPWLTTTTPRGRCTTHWPVRPVMSVPERPRRVRLLRTRAPRSLAIRCGRSSGVLSSRICRRAVVSRRVRRRSG